MNSRWCVFALLLGLSGPVSAADAVIIFNPNAIGAWLIMLGIAFLLAEAMLPSYGVIGLGGILTFVVGSVILMNADRPGFSPPAPLLIGLALVSTVLLIALLIHALRTRPKHAVSGDAGLLGSVTPITSIQAGNACRGWVHLQGEQWQVLSTTPLQSGQPVRVVARRGLMLEVAAADAAPQGE